MGKKEKAVDEFLDALVWMRRKAKKHQPVDELIDALIKMRRKAKRKLEATAKSEKKSKKKKATGRMASKRGTMHLGRRSRKSDSGR